MWLSWSHCGSELKFFLHPVNFKSFVQSTHPWWRVELQDGDATCGGVSDLLGSTRPPQGKNVPRRPSRLKLQGNTHRHTENTNELCHHHCVWKWHKCLILNLKKIYILRHWVRKSKFVYTSVRRIRSFLCALCSLIAEDQILLKNMQELGLLPLL